MTPVTSADSPQRRQALAIVSRLREAGHIAYFAGGCVRDLLLEKTPKDYDVATDATPQRVRELFRNSQAVGAAFGVILVRGGGTSIEVATFRSDGRYLDGRRPSEIQFTDAEQDAKRRDFTVNGLFLDPVDDRVIDFVGGLNDLAARRIRAIGDPAKRFDEDSLRLLRAVRFSARLSFEIEPATAEAIRAHSEQLRRISPERMAEELRLTLSPTTRRAAWPMLWDLGLIQQVFRFLPAAGNDAARNGEFLFVRVAPSETVSFGLALAAAAICYQLRMSAAATDVRALLTRNAIAAASHAMRQSLRISNLEQSAMEQTLRGVSILLAETVPGLAVLKRFLSGPEADSSRS